MNFFQAIDALRMLRRPVAGDYVLGLRRRIARLFPGRSNDQRETILRGFVRYALLNRLIYRLTMWAPALAAIASRYVRIVGRPAIAAANEHRGPVIVVSAHFGSLYLLSFIVARALPGRHLYLMHKNTIADAPRDAAFLRRHGITPVAADERGLLTLVRALQDDPRTAIMLAFDVPTGKRNMLPFLGTHVPVSSGIGMLADVGRCPVVPLFWQYDGLRPSVIVNEPMFAENDLPVSQRRITLVTALYALLEERVARIPEQWQLDLIAETHAPETPTITERP